MLKFVHQDMTIFKMLTLLEENKNLIGMWSAYNLIERTTYYTHFKEDGTYVLGSIHDSLKLSEAKKITELKNGKWLLNNGSITFGEGEESEINEVNIIAAKHIITTAKNGLLTHYRRVGELEIQALRALGL